MAIKNIPKHLITAVFTEVMKQITMFRKDLLKDYVKSNLNSEFKKFTSKSPVYNNIKLLFRRKGIVGIIIDKNWIGSDENREVRTLQQLNDTIKNEIISKEAKKVFTPISAADLDRYITLNLMKGKTQDVVIENAIKKFSS